MVTLKINEIGANIKVYLAKWTVLQRRNWNWSQIMSSGRLCTCNVRT